jgi:hypothetical protein
MLRKYLKKAEISGASIQTLRHTFGGIMLQKGPIQKQSTRLWGFRIQEPEPFISPLLTG